MYFPTQPPHTSSLLSESVNQFQSLGPDQDKPKLNIITNMDSKKHHINIKLISK